MVLCWRRRNYQDKNKNIKVVYSGQRIDINLNTWTIGLFCFALFLKSIPASFPQKNIHPVMEETAAEYNRGIIGVVYGSSWNYKVAWMAEHNQRYDRNMQRNDQTVYSRTEEWRIEKDNRQS